jgi:hypothetical protein
MGRDCFLSAIGLPRVRNSQPKCPILPADQYESLAAGMLKQLDALTDQEWIQYWQHYYGDDMLVQFHLSQNLHDRHDTYRLIIFAQLRRQVVVLIFEYCDKLVLISYSLTSL